MLKLESKYYRSNFQLALPVVLANVGQSIVQIVDNVMVGRLGTSELAAAAFSGIVVNTLMVAGMGVALGLTPVVGQSYVAGRFRKASSFFQNAISLNALVGIAITSILLLLIPVLPYMGQPPQVIEMGRGYYLLLSFSMIPYMLFLSSKQFMEGIGNTRVAMVITISVNLLNILLNYLFIYGKFGFPAWGVTGAGFATFTARLLMPVLFFLYITRQQPYRRYFRFFSRNQLSISRQRKLLLFGMPISGQIILEMAAFSASVIMMGWISETAIAAHQIVMTMTQFMFLLASGIAGASTILVSHQYGRRDAGEIRKYALAGMRMSVLVMTAAALLFFCFGRYIALGFTPDPEVAHLAAVLFIVVGLYEISDGLQVTALGALRGINDVKKPMVLAFISYILINLPVAYLFGFTLNMGPVGICIGFIFGLTVAAVLYIRRFNRTLRKMEKGKPS